jgi:TolA-binding protein
MPLVTVALVVLAFIAGLVTGGGDSADKKYEQYYARAAELYRRAQDWDSPPADAKDPKRWARVLAAYRAVFDGYPDSPFADDALYAVASRIDVQDQPDTAFALYRRLLNNYPDSEHAAPTVNAIGVALFQRREYDRAVVLFDRLLTEYPTSPLAEKAYLNRAIAQYERGTYDAALKELQQFLDRYPATEQRAAPRFYEAMVHYRRQDFELARVSFQNIVDLNDKEYAPAAQFNIGQAYFDERRYDEAVTAYRRTMEAYPESEFAQEAHFRIGWALERQQKYAESVAELKKAVEKYPKSSNSPAAQLFIAEIYAEGLKDLPNAVKAYRAVVDETVDVRAIETDQRSAYDIRRHAQFKIGELYEKRGQYADAVREYERLLKDFPERHSAPTHPSNDVDEGRIVDLRARAATKPS